MQGATNFCQLRHKLSFKPLRFNSKSLSLENAIGFYQSLDNDMHLWLSLRLKIFLIFSTERNLLVNWSSSWNFYRVVPRCIFTVLAWHTLYPQIWIEIASASHSLHLRNPLKFSVLRDKNCLFDVEISVKVDCSRGSEDVELLKYQTSTSLHRLKCLSSSV